MLVHYLIQLINFDIGDIRKDSRGLDHIWTPWRMKYIQQNNQDDGCIFCLAANGEDDRENLIFYRGVYAFML